MRVNGLLLLLALAVTGCIKPFILENESYEELLVVEGVVTNEPGPYAIKISTATPIDQVVYHALEGCEVYVLDGSGNRFNFYEFETGVYSSDSATFRGQVGERYRLHITTPQGEQYQSSWEEILPSLAVVDIREEYQEKDDPDEALGVFGYQFYVDAEDASADSVNLIWQVDATYEYRADFKIDFYYEGVLRPFPRRDLFYVCYKTARIPEIFTFSTAGQAGSQVKNQALHYEDTRSRALTYTYSLNVRQLRVGWQAYEFWDELKQLKQLQGEVFDRQPFQVNGNIVNVGDVKERALGYFMAAGVSSRREFFRWNFGKFNYPTCVITDANIMAYGDIFRSAPSQWPIYITAGPGGVGPRAVVADPCIDCRKFGGVLEKPPFWE